MKRYITYSLLAVTFLGLVIGLLYQGHNIKNAQQKIESLSSENQEKKQKLQEYELFMLAFNEFLGELNLDLQNERDHFSVFQQLDRIYFGALDTSDALKQKIENFIRINESLTALTEDQRMELFNLQSNTSHKEHFLKLELIELNNQKDSLEQLLESVRELYNRFKIDTIRFVTPKKIDVLYYGQLSQGEPNGLGVGLYTGHGNYLGEWKGTKRHGKGKHSYLNGDVYEGNFEEDKRSGYGIYTYASGEIYRGQWKNDLMHGLGEIRFANGKIVSGTWHEGKKKENVQ